MVASAWIGLVEIVGYRLARHDEGLALAHTADIAVLRTGSTHRWEERITTFAAAQSAVAPQCL